MEMPWDSYKKAMDNTPIPVCSNPPMVKYPTTAGDKWWTGFQPLIPANPEVQAKYDAMSPTWEGVAPTNISAVNQIFATEPLPIDKTLPERK
jgi:hypothetical protein